MNVLLSALGWFWFVLAGIIAASMIGQGSPVTGIGMAASALFALPPLWQKLSETKYGLKVSHRFAGGISAFILAFGIAVGSEMQTMSPESSAEQGFSDAKQATEKAARTANAPKPVSETERMPEEIAPLLAELEQKIAQHAVIVMEQRDHPKLYNQLGRTGFKRANELAQWAGLSAALNSKCDKVDLVEVSEKSTKENINWFVDCENGERFEINEVRATETKRQLTSPSSKTAKSARAIAARNKPQPNSAAVDKLDTADEAKIVGLCDRTIETTLKSRGSYDPSWSYKYRKHPTRGRVSVTRDFEASNSFGGTMSSRYECIIDAKSTNLVSLRIQEPTGWKTLYSR